MSSFRVVKRWHRPLAGASVVAVLLALSACGGSSDASPPTDIGTLAYVSTECRDTADGFSEHQALHILHGEQDVTVMETPGVGPIAGVGGVCRFLTSLPIGPFSVVREAFQTLAVSPDGAAVVFEVSDDFSINPQLPLHLPPEQRASSSCAPTAAACGRWARRVDCPSTSSWQVDSPSLRTALRSVRTVG